MEKTFLAHGLWMSGYACLYWRQAVREAGLNPILFSYPTAWNHMDQNADRLFKAVKRHSTSADRVNFVGHSMGGMVILHMLRRHGAQFGQNGLPQLGRVVVCGSPINGSHVAQTIIRQWPVLGHALGRSIIDWPGISRDELPQSLELGVLAGTRNLGLGRVIKTLPQPSDGTVSLSETELQGGETDRIRMNMGHAEMLVAPAASRQIVHFLQNGRFLHRTDAAFQSEVAH